MNLKLRVVSMAAVFFTGSLVMAQQDTLSTTKVEEVVIVGIQKKNRDEITQAVSVVNGDELNRLSASSTGVSNMLQGKMSGLQVGANSGKPGEPGSIRIRGAVNVSAVLGASDPLFVVDGIYMTQRQFNSVPSTDIESVTLLKDAAASSVYGSRAANGVLIVTTKRGKSGVPQITYDTRFGFGFKPKNQNFTLMNAAQKIQYENELSVLGVNSNPVYTAAEQATLLSQEHDWEKDILRNSAIEYHNLSATGGGEKNKYYVSLGYDSDSGILEELKGYKRYNGRFNFDQTVTDKLKLSFDFSVINTLTNDQRFSYNALSPFYSIFTLNAYEPIYNPNGTFNGTSNSINPIDLVRNEVTNDVRTRFTGQGALTYEIIKGLSFKTSFANIYDLRKNKYVVRKGSDIASVYGIPDGQIRDTRSDLYSYVFTNRLDFSRKFGKHKIDAVALMEFNKDDFGSLSGTKRVQLAGQLTDIGSAATPAAITGNTISTRLESYLGLLDYNYDDRYLLSGSIRRDGSSKLGQDKKYGDFYSGSAAWNLAKESFFDVPFFNDIKFRYSLGTTGLINSLLDYQNIASVVAGDYGTDPTSGPSNFVGNTDIEWEKKFSQNLGVDLSMYNRRIKISAELFKDKRNDFIYAIANTPYEGGGYLYSSIVNAGDITIKGFESEIGLDVIRSNDFDFSLRGNISMLKYNVESLYKANTQLSLDGYTFMKVGAEPTAFKLVKSAGVDSQNGDALYYKLDGSITNVYSSGDAQFLDGKSTLPNAYGGFGTTMRYKRFDLNGDFSFQTGGYSVNITYLNTVDFANYSSNMSTDAFDYWRNPGDISNLPKPNGAGLQLTDQFLQKTDFLRFRSLELGYTFSKDFLGENVPIRSIRVYGSGQNLALWTNYKGDPEIGVASETQVNNSAFVPGSYSLYNYPNTRTFLLGMQVNF